MARRIAGVGRVKVSERRSTVVIAASLRAGVRQSSVRHDPRPAPRSHGLPAPRRHPGDPRPHHRLDAVHPHPGPGPGGARQLRDRAVRRRPHPGRPLLRAPEDLHRRPGAPGGAGPVAHGPGHAAPGDRRRHPGPGRDGRGPARRLLLLDQPGDRGAGGRRLRAGREPGDGLRHRGPRPPGPHRAHVRRAQGRAGGGGQPGHPGPAAGPGPLRRGLRVHVLPGVEREAPGADRAPGRRGDAGHQGTWREDPVGRRTGGGPHRRRPVGGAADRGRLHGRAVRRQRPGHPRHRGRPVRHLARGQPGRGDRGRARPRAPHPGPQHRPPLRLDRQGGRAGRAHLRDHARLCGARGRLRPRRLGPRRRAPARTVTTWSRPSARCAPCSAGSATR